MGKYVQQLSKTVASTSKQICSKNCCQKLLEQSYMLFSAVCMSFVFGISVLLILIFFWFGFLKFTNQARMSTMYLYFCGIFTVYTCK